MQNLEGALVRGDSPTSPSQFQFDLSLPLRIHFLEGFDEIRDRLYCLMDADAASNG